MMEVSWTWILTIERGLSRGFRPTYAISLGIWVTAVTPRLLVTKHTQTKKKKRGFWISFFYNLPLDRGGGGLRGGGAMLMLGITLLCDMLSAVWVQHRIA